MKRYASLLVIVLLLSTVCCSYCVAEANSIPIKYISLDRSKATLLRSQTLQLTASVLPKTATNTAFAWSSSDESIAVVSSAGVVTPISCGSARITCSATDGSKKQASCAVFIPTISVESKNITVSSPKGVKIPVSFYGDDLRAESSCLYFKFDSSIQAVYIWPIAKGAGTLVLTDTGNKKNTVVLNITIEASAVFDTADYPARDVGAMAHYMKDYVGQKIGIKGTVKGIESFWQEGDGPLDYSHRFLLVKTRLNQDHGLLYWKYYCVRVPFSDLSPKIMNGESIQVCGTIAQGKSNTIENYQSAMAKEYAALLQGWHFLNRAIGLSEKDHPEENDCFYYIDADWYCYLR